MKKDNSNPQHMGGPSFNPGMPQKADDGVDAKAAEAKQTEKQRDSASKKTDGDRNHM